MGILHVFDLDDTLVKSKAKIGVVNRHTKKLLRFVWTSEYGSDVLAPHEEYEYSGMRDSQCFWNTAKPLVTLYKAAVIQNYLRSEDRLLVLTARPIPDNLSLFASTLWYMGLRVPPHRLLFSGDLNIDSPQRSKPLVLDAYLRLCGRSFSFISVYDDSKENLDAFRLLLKDHGSVSLNHVLPLTSPIE